MTTLTDNDDTYSALFPGEAVFGLAGNDLLGAHAAGSSLYGGDGDDTLNGGPGDDYLQGDDDNNYDGHNLIYGGGGDDSILILSGRDEVHAGSGDDEVTAGAVGEGQIVRGDAGVDTLVMTGMNTFSSVVIDFGSSFTAVANNLDRSTYLDFERLVFIGGEFRYEVYGADLDDSFIVNNQNAATFKSGILDGRDGDDDFTINQMSAGAKPQFVLGGNGNDSLRWGQSGEIGDLQVRASGKMIADGRTFLAFTSIESLQVSANQVTGTLNYSGLAGSDILSATAGHAIVSTGQGDDSVSITSGRANINVGAGNDSVDVDSDPAGLVQVSGGSGADSLQASGKASLFGNGGNDSLYSSGSLASLYGGSGKDSLTRQGATVGAATSDAVLDGGGGLDTLTLNFSLVSTTVRADFSRSTVTLYDGATVRGCEIVHYNGGYGTDIITSSRAAGGAVDNIVNGGSGNDILRAAAAGAALDGGYGDDVLKGRRGDDILNGGFGGNDTIRGNGGRDRITGGNGLDVMTGGSKADTFVFTSWGDARVTDTAWDRITDFHQAQRDRIDLTAIDANAATVGIDDAFIFVGADGLTGAAGEVGYRQIDNAGTKNDVTFVEFTIIAGGVAFAIALDGLIDLHKSDFLL